MLDETNILIVEDEALLAVDLSITLEDEGASITGPCLSLDSAMAISDGVDAAVLDVDLRGVPVFPLADRLYRSGTPFVFHTGRADLAELRNRYGDDVPILVKPTRPEEVVRTLSSVLSGAAETGAARA